jgi:hypothetical protein
MLSFFMALPLFADSTPRAYRLKAGNADLPISTGFGTFPVIAKKMDNNRKIESTATEADPRDAPRLAEINGLEPEMENLSDDELRRKTEELKARLRADKPAINGSQRKLRAPPQSS